MQFLLLFSFSFPVVSGALLPLFKPKPALLRVWVTLTSAFAFAASLIIAFAGGDASTSALSLAPGLSIAYSADTAASVFSVLFSFAFLIVSIYAPTYIAHEHGGAHGDRFFAFFLITLGALLSLSFSANLVTLYLSFEITTLASMPLVLQSGEPEAVAAALKYLFYSVAGALLGLFGIIFIHSYTAAGAFAPGGTLTEAGPYLPLAVFLTIVGFGTKAGMYPMHGWLPTAHPVAPAPASALLSGIIAKAGVLAVIRVVFYTVGADAIRSTWVTPVWEALAALTVVMGSMMAYREKILKKRLAYSTVSNISYIMLGLSTMTATGSVGALLHVFAHALAKNALFLAAGSIIFMTGKTSVDELHGIGKKMPVTLGAFTVASLSLIGIPPLLGFTSKWYLCTAGIEVGGVSAVLVPAVLIISALLTAGYLLPIMINGYFPAEGAPSYKYEEAPASMTVPTVILAALSLILGLFGDRLAVLFASVITL